jgi:hypothetical protein
MKLAALDAVFPAIYLAYIGIQILTIPKYEVLNPTKKLKFVSVALEEILRVAGSCIFTLL